MSASSPDPDAALLRAVARGEPGAARAMVAAKLGRIHALAARLLGDAGEAEDVAQETFLRLWKQAPRWREGEARIDTWLHRVALNLCTDRLRRRRERPTDDLPETIDPDPLALDRLLAADVSARVAAALAALPVRQREAIVLSYYQELGDGETAALMAISVEAVESLLARARRTLRRLLADERDDG